MYVDSWYFAFLGPQPCPKKKNWSIIVIIPSCSPGTPWPVEVGRWGYVAGRGVGGDWVGGGVGKVGAVCGWRAVGKEVGVRKGLGREWWEGCWGGCEMWVGGCVVG